jgi:hypothetical protein
MKYFKARQLRDFNSKTEQTSDSYILWNPLVKMKTVIAVIIITADVMSVNLLQFHSNFLFGNSYLPSIGL